MLKARLLFIALSFLSSRSERFARSNALFLGSEIILSFTLVKNLGGAPDVSCTIPPSSPLAYLLSKGTPAGLLSDLCAHLVGPATAIEETLTIMTPKLRLWQDVAFLSAFTTVVNGTKVMYVLWPANKKWKDWEFKECILALLGLSQERLGCHEVIICLGKPRERLAAIARDLIYADFSLVRPEQVGGLPDYVFMRYAIEPL